MIGLVIVTHGRLAVEFRAALEHVVGPQSQIEAEAHRLDRLRSSTAILLAEPKLRQYVRGVWQSAASPGDNGAESCAAWVSGSYTVTIQAAQSVMPGGAALKYTTSEVSSSA